MNINNTLKKCPKFGSKKIGENNFCEDCLADLTEISNKGNNSDWFQ
ncbi:MAG: hypothetical protein ACMXX5_01470 [Candidatus Woesearchaeota archaeon]